MSPVVLSGEDKTELKGIAQWGGRLLDRYFEFSPSSLFADMFVHSDSISLFSVLRLLACLLKR